jgi:penicillin amidase
MKEVFLVGNKMNQADWLRRLGAGETIEQVCTAAGWSREEFDAWWQAECRRRVPRAEMQLECAELHEAVSIVRDDRGVPHVDARSRTDAYIAFGFVVAQDRLFQLDYLRRRARGTLAEVLGKSAIDSDRLYRTLDLQSVAERELAAMPVEIRELLEAYAAGVNAWLRICAKNGAGEWPLEFDLLDYRPGPWSAVDSLLLTGDFRWYLTGRFPVIIAPELVKRAVGEGPLYNLYLGAELDDECILPTGSYAPRSRSQAAGMSEEAGGSNNWVMPLRSWQAIRMCLFRLCRCGMRCICGHLIGM